MCSGPSWSQPVSLLDQALPRCWPPCIHLCSPVVCVLSPGSQRDHLSLLFFFYSVSLTAPPLVHAVEIWNHPQILPVCHSLHLIMSPSSIFVSLMVLGPLSSLASTTTVLVHFILIDPLSKYRSPASHLTCFCSIFHTAANYLGKVCI